jgi:hypothetical protein
MIDIIETEINEETFTIADDSMAEWALQKVLEAKAERERLTDLVKAEAARLKTQQELIDKRYENSTGFLLTHLYRYFNTVEHKNTKTQETYQLLSGKLVFKKPKPEANKSEDALLEWCKNNAPEFVKTSESVAWAELKKNLVYKEGKAILKDTGEVVGGISVEESLGSFDVSGD